MWEALLSFLVVVVAGYLIGGAAPLLAQDAFSPGTVVALQGTPHLWIADEQGILHWGGDTRALAGKHIAWSNRVEVSLDQLRTLPVGDPWLSAGLLKDGDPIYLVKWETDWPQPQLLHIQSIKDVELFGINGGNYGKFVLGKNEWERRFGLATVGLQRGTLSAAIPEAVPTPAAAPPMVAPPPAAAPQRWHRRQLPRPQQWPRRRPRPRLRPHPRPHPRLGPRPRPHPRRPRRLHLPQPLSLYRNIWQLCGGRGSPNQRAIG